MFQEVWGSQAKVDVIMKLFGMFHCSGTLVRRRVGGAQEGGWCAGGWVGSGVMRGRGADGWGHCGTCGRRLTN